MILKPIVSKISAVGFWCSMVNFLIFFECCTRIAQQENKKKKKAAAEAAFLGEDLNSLQVEGVTNKTHKEKHTNTWMH